jgi:hypothetical protein
MESRALAPRRRLKPSLDRTPHREGQHPQTPSENRGSRGRSNPFHTWLSIPEERAICQQGTWLERPGEHQDQHHNDRRELIDMRGPDPGIAERGNQRRRDPTHRNSLVEGRPELPSLR